jgi:hypothetical protein
MARREVTGRGPANTDDLGAREGGSPDPEDDEDGYPEDDDQPAADLIDQPDPDSDESDDDESDDVEPIKHGEPAAQALVAKPPIRGPPRRLTRKEQARKAKARPERTVPDEGDAYSIQEFCKRHRISIQLFYKYENDMPDTFNVGKRRLISREAAARWRAEREEAGAAKAVKAAAAIADELCEGKTVRTTPEADAKWRAKREGAAVASGTAGPINSDTTA